MTPSNALLHLAPRAGKVAVIGANSNLGRRIVRALGDDALPIVRGLLPGEISTGAVVVSDYACIDEQALADCVAVVNCVGLASGTPEMMRRVNAEISKDMAVAAANSGISRFVHISSFSVYGKAQRIAGSTSEAPLDAYGESKLKGDQALLSITAMDVAILRLPAVIGQGVPSKLSQLVRIWRKAPALPVARNAQRSMISIDAAAAAACVLARAEGPVGGKWLVADPDPVDLRRLARLTDIKRQSRLRTLVLPDLVTAGLRRLLPGIFEKVFGSSILADEANAFLSLGLTARLDDEILRMIEE
jgi:nucleoside-diphosphate-sugar epimerase